MDYMRGTYLSDMVLWQGGEPIPGYWFPAPVGAEVLQDPSPFRARKVWSHPEDEDQPLGESATQQFHFRGDGNTVGYDGLHFCGEMEAFREGGIPGVTDPIITESDGSAPCCLVPVPPPAVLNFWTVSTPIPVRQAGISSPWVAGSTGWFIFHTRAIGASPAPHTLVGWEEVYTSLTEEPALSWWYRTTVFRREIDGSEPYPIWTVPLTGPTAWIGAGFTLAGNVEFQDAETEIIPLQTLTSDLTVVAPRFFVGPGSVAVNAYILTSGADPIAKSAEWVLNATGFPSGAIPAFKGFGCRIGIAPHELSPYRFVTIPSGIITGGWMSTIAVKKV